MLLRTIWNVTLLDGELCHVSALFQETRKFRGMYLCALFLVSSEVYAEETIKMYEPRSACTCKVANTVQTEP